MPRKTSTPMIRHLPLTKLRHALGNIVNRVHRDKEYVVVERSGLPLVAIMDIDEFEDYLELRDPEAQRDIEASRRDIEAGRVRPAEELLAEIDGERAGAHRSSVRSER